MGSEKGWNRSSGREEVMPELPPELAGLPPETLQALLEGAPGGELSDEEQARRDEEHDRRQRLVIYRCAALTGLIQAHGEGALHTKNMRGPHASCAEIVETAEVYAHAMLKAEKPPEGT